LGMRGGTTNQGGAASATGAGLRVTKTSNASQPHGDLVATIHPTRKARATLKSGRIRTSCPLKQRSHADLLIRCTRGAMHTVALDLRLGSPPDDQHGSPLLESWRDFRDD
jgi:hypothetical protein